MKITPAKVTFNENGTPYAEQFADLYFSDTHGIAETEHVFIQHNQVLTRLQSCQTPTFVIAETGFGTGLNFIVTLAHYIKLQNSNQASLPSLHFISVEKFPLSLADLRTALAHYPSLQNLCEPLLAAYPMALEGCHRLAFAQGKVRLDLWFGDVHDVLPHLLCPPEGLVDAWYLDGFAPSKNPEMWTACLFQQMARLCKQGATFATFTAAGLVKRGLQDAGFSIEKRPGHGQKRHNLVGHLSHKKPQHWGKPYYARPSANTPVQHVAIIGGGIAAASCAHALAQRQISSAIYCQDAALTQGASGNVQGAIYPHLNAVVNAAGVFYAQAYLYALRCYQRLADQGAHFAHQWCGVLQVAFNENVTARYQSLVRQQQWPEALVQWLSAEQASVVANINLPYAGLYFPHGGWVNPPQLVADLVAQAKAQIHLNQRLVKLEQRTCGWTLHFADGSSQQAEQVILCVGNDNAAIMQTADLPLRLVRGQIEHIQSEGELTKLATVLCHKGYLTPAYNGQHALGSSYVKGDPHCDYRQAEQQSNLLMHKKALSACEWAQQLEGHSQGRAAIRSGTADHLPMVGAVPNLPMQKVQFADLYKALPALHYPPAINYQGLYMMNGLGSRGLTTAPLLAEILVSQLCAEPLPVSVDIADMLSPNRFLIRALIRREL
ncbi:MAG: bifunctional tRNA (5-methylaminomethyl-2-thiouridine)(34)-methyltransferase MnmD/FAD-dependent 5-carboxymethylaminomethyl-2-thiouridine(34) oxidoreductase MnmC [Paraglaciecola sp.]|nr:bifunctional tRNA (5-methylaminomethyl-2-thiouridine)(34)-methyltransferase MnmD/FAD-dependent 5-carboxymethylaminomethyl-2-thiouridine(34) oxidoreductase MnmC [Paraglaciecola sp.]NCT47611.1 bifunctional tRNA (5-methylaminomethyl-2-thiouridine)(34)-methyltransferase MnmD/FAD-dependent 5-carboxymethylaminomethyl-2-thiouridine(34) oxidoreductase MnmC [Paraglaciecola sp.]